MPLSAAGHDPKMINTDKKYATKVGCKISLRTFDRPHLAGVHVLAAPETTINIVSQVYLQSVRRFNGENTRNFFLTTTEHISRFF
eukprot:g59599.t1